MDRLIEEFVLYVYKNQDKDVESILNRYDIVKISWHIYFKDITDYATSSKSS